MVFLEKGKAMKVVFDVVSVWVSDKRILGNLELDCMDASLAFGGAHKGPTDFSIRLKVMMTRLH